VTAPIATARLRLEPVSAALAAEVLAGDLSSVRAGDGWPHADTTDGLRLALGEGHPPVWLVLLDDVVIGDCGVHAPPDAEGSVEIGYGLAPPYRGQGYGTELVAALSRWLLDQPDVRRVFARGVEQGNRASRRVLERAGFRVVGGDSESLEYVLELASGRP
jgi:RimJ/RimL family protein N-acetyltransferase